jgi:hypothetical protein
MSYCSCGYKYFAALPLFFCCGVSAFTNILVLCTFYFFVVSLLLQINSLLYTFCYVVLFLWLQIFRGSAAVFLLWCFCFYKYFGALHLLLFCCVTFATNIPVLCTFRPVLLFLWLQIFRGSAAVLFAEFDYTKKFRGSAADFK